MQEQLISLETAKLAKERGFKPKREWNPDYVPGYIEDDYEGYVVKFTEFQEEDYVCEGYYLAPTQSLLQRWLREVHNIKVFIDDCSKEELNQYFWFRPGYTDTKSYKTYEEALEVGLIEALEQLK